MQETAIERVSREAKKILDFIDILDTAKKQNVKLIDAVHDMNNKQQDILHEIEITKMYNSKGVHTLNELKRLRQERRVAKDTLDLWRPIKEFANKHPELKEELKDVLKKINEVINIQTSRVYYPRIKENSLIAGKHYGAPRANIDKIVKNL